MLICIIGYFILDILYWSLSYMAEYYTEREIEATKESPFILLCIFFWPVFLIVAIAQVYIRVLDKCRHYLKVLRQEHKIKTEAERIRKNTYIHRPNLP